MAPIINSVKNTKSFAVGLTGTVAVVDIAKAKDAPVTTVADDVQRGCIIKAVWCSLDACGLAGTGVSNSFSAYVLKNVGANLTPPSAFSVGQSNEKKFIFKQWQSMIMRIQDGPNPYHWEGWIKIPKRYQRMGTDDILQLGVECTTAVTGLCAGLFIYKWYT